MTAASLAQAPTRTSVWLFMSMSRPPLSEQPNVDSGSPGRSSALNSRENSMLVYKEFPDRLAWVHRIPRQISMLTKNSLIDKHVYKEFPDILAYVQRIRRQINMLSKNSLIDKYVYKEFPDRLACVQRIPRQINMFTKNSQID